ncbi:MAG: hypothetical protein LBV75_05280, partial [Paludibacter sp.]|nr:hypothetical protein [Paludibacter sp.]
MNTSNAVIKFLLFGAVGLLLYFCIRSILAPIEFENKKTERQEIVIQQLIDIRTAQLEYKAH